jgi:hypothetical protein
MVSGWTNFCGARCLGSGFDILEEFARALALGLWGQGILLLLRVLVTIIDAQMAAKVFCRELSKINVSETDFTKVAQSYELDCNLALLTRGSSAPSEGWGALRARVSGPFVIDIEEQNA